MNLTRTFAAYLAPDGDELGEVAQLLSIAGGTGVEIGVELQAMDQTLHRARHVLVVGEQLQHVFTFFVGQRFVS